MTKKTPSFSIFMIVTIIFIIISTLYYFYSRILPLFNNDKKEDLRNNLLSNFEVLNSTFYGQRILENAGKFMTPCAETTYCSEFKNDSNNWTGFFNYNNPVFLSEYNLIFISFQNKDGKAGINLIGKISNDPNKWWLDRSGITINSQNEYLEIDADSGTSHNPVILYLEKFPANEKGFQEIIIYLDKLGNIISIYDKKGSLIKNFKYTNLNLNNKSNGFFPEGKIFIGLTAEPNSTLRINNFVGMSVIKYE